MDRVDQGPQRRASRRRDSDKEIRLTTDGREGLAYGNARMVARFEDAGRLSHRAGRAEGGVSGRVVAARRRPGDAAHRGPIALPGDKFTAYELHLFDVAEQKADRVPGRSDRFRHAAAALERRRPHVHLSAGRSRPSATAADRGRCPHGQQPQSDRREDRHVHLDGPHRERRTSGRFNWLEKTDEIHLRLRARRLAAPVSGRCQGRGDQEPDHEGRVRRSRHRADRRGEAADLVPRQRPQSRPGPVFHPLLPRQLRRHRPGGADRRQRHAHGSVFARREVPRSTPTRASISRRFTSCGARATASSSASWKRPTSRS